MNSCAENEPNETGWYHHQNGHGADEIVYLEFSMGTLWVYKINGNSYPIQEDKGTFGPRILTLSEVAANE